MSIDLESLYRDLHAHPELAFAEHETARRVAELVTDLGLEVTTGVGRTGVVAVLANGDGPVVHLRADMDGLPVREETGLTYASTATVQDRTGAETPLMHACGHDMHVTCLVGALERLIRQRNEWSGTVVALFQPAEEAIDGARAMVADGLAERFPKPDVVLGQHVIPLPAGVVSLTAGPAMASVDLWDITFTGQGGHGSRPQSTVDPIVAAAAAVLRLQTVVSREVVPGRLAVVTVGTMHAGTKSNIIPATATLGLSVRTSDAETRAGVLASIERICRAEALASGMDTEPTITVVGSGDATVNDVDATERLRSRFSADFGADAVTDIGILAGSEDVGDLATATGAPLVYWFFGGTDPEAYATAVTSGTVERDIPTNHSPHFAPLLQPTLDNGVRNLVTATLEWLGKR